MKTKKLLLLALLSIFVLSCEEDPSLKKGAYYNFNVTDIANMVGKSYSEQTSKLKNYLISETTVAGGSEGSYRVINGKDRFAMKIFEGSDKKIETIIVVADTDNPDHDMYIKYNKIVAEKAELNYILCDQGDLDEDHLLYNTFSSFLKALQDGKIPKGYEFTAEYTLGSIDIYVMYSSSYLGIAFL